MSSLILLRTLCALAVSSLITIWLLASRKTHVASTIENQTTSRVTLPKGWWSSAERFQAERRAIFSQTWLCVSHRGRFKTPGDYIVYNVAGFPFFMMLGKDKVVRSFHNVCRHRAFPLARKDHGSATILGCRYHGWSYDYTGRLIKAPFFDNKPGFDKSQNSLFEISTKEDRNGFLYINPATDVGITKSMPERGPATGKLIKITPDVFQLYSFELSGVFNWKLLVNDFGPSSMSLQATGVTKLFPTLFATPEARLDLYPLTTVHTSSGSDFWYQLTYNPISATKTSVRCDVYSVKSSGSPELEVEVKNSLEQKVKQRIQALENEYKTVTSFGSDMVSTNAFQKQIASVVKSHVEREKLGGSEIKPAEVKAQPTGQNTAKAELLCAAVECGDKELDW